MIFRVAAGRSWPHSRSRRSRARRGGEAVTDARFGGRKDEPTEWVTVYWASGLEEAHVVRGRLLSEDIPVLLKTEAAVFGIAGVVGVQVRVPRPLEDRALEVIGAV